MTASRNTIWVIGLMFLAWTASQTAPAADYPASGGAASGPDGVPPAAPAPDMSVPSGPGSVGGSPGSVGNPAISGVLTTDDGRHPLLEEMQKCVDETPSFAACAREFNDLCAICQGCTWKADASSLILHRSTPGTSAVLFDTATGAEVFGATDLKFPFAAGPRLAFTILDCEGWGFEANYFGVDGWSSTTDIPASSLPNFGNLTVDSVNQLTLTDAHFDSTSRLYSVEVNFRKPWFGNFAFLAGFRWLEAMDRYFVQGTSATTGNVATETILTHNHLYGFQVGTDGILLQKQNCWRLTGFVKGGIFLNSADQATFLSDPGGLGSLSVNTNNQGCASFFGETGLVGYYQITKHLSANGGYEVMFLNNVAQPVNQLAVTNLTTGAATVDVSRGLFYNGATAGLELTW